LDFMLLIQHTSSLWPLNSRPLAFFKIGGRFIIDYILEEIKNYSPRKVFLVSRKEDRKVIEKLLEKWSEALRIEPYYFLEESLLNAIDLISPYLESSRIIGIFGQDLFAVKFIHELIEKTNSYILHQEHKLRAINIERRLVSSIANSSSKQMILKHRLITQHVFPKYAWHLTKLREFFLKTLLEHSVSRSAKISKWAIIEGKVFIGEEARIMRNAIINGPAYIGSNTIIGDHTLVRDSIIEDNSIIGCFMEVARSYSQSNLETHSGYLGDSIIDRKVHLGAGFISANLRLDRGEIWVKIHEKKINTGLKKLGAVIGEETEIGVNVSIMPGKLIGRRVRIWPGSIVFKNIEDNTDYIPKIEYVTRVRETS